MSVVTEEIVAPPNAIAVAGGADQSGLRLYNERLILSLVRRSGQLSKIEVARMTGLSIQSSSTIMNRLQADGLLRREAPLRGRVGQPTVPVSLDPEGAFSIGLKIGRRSCDLALIDFCGRVRRRAQRHYPYPTPRRVSQFVVDELAPIAESLTLGAASPHRRARRRDPVPVVGLVERDRRAGRRNGRLALVLDRRGIGAAVAVSRNVVQ